MAKANNYVQQNMKYCKCDWKERNYSQHASHVASFLQVIIAYFAIPISALIIDDFQLMNDHYVLENNIADRNYDVHFPLSYDDDEEWAIS